jgi:hypothetical protein
LIEPLRLAWSRRNEETQQDLHYEEIAMKKLNITKEQYAGSEYQKKYGNLKFVSESRRGTSTRLTREGY